MKLFKQLKYIAIVCLCFMLQACPIGEYGDDGTETDIRFINKTDSTLYVGRGYSSDDVKGYFVMKWWDRETDKVEPNDTLIIPQVSQDEIRRIPLKIYVVKESTYQHHTDELFWKLDVDSIIFCTADSAKAYDYTYIYKP